MAEPLRAHPGRRIERTTVDPLSDGAESARLNILPTGGWRGASPEKKSRMSPGASELSRAGRSGRDDRTPGPGLIQPRLAGLAAVAFIAVGVFGAYRYVENYWTYRGFAPPHDAPFVKVHGTTVRFYRREPRARRPPPAGRRLSAARATRRTRTGGTPSLYLLHGVPGRPGAFLATVRMGVVEDELVALRRARPLILVMPFGSTGSFTDKEWANGDRQEPGLGDVRLPRRRPTRSTTGIARFRRGNARALVGLSEGGYGALNIGIHHPREFHVLESWSGYSAPTTSRRSSAIARRCCAHNSPSTRCRAPPPALRRAHTYMWFYTRHRRPLPCGRTPGSPSALAANCIAASLLPRPRRPQLGALARQCRARAARALPEGCMRKARAFPILVATAFAATGWLYLVRPALPGPRIGEALPLDELAKHARRRFSGSSVVWLVAAALGLYARSAGFERLTAALLLGVGIGLFGYLQTGVSIAVVRQVSLRDALDSAARMQAPSIRPPRSSRSPVALLAPAGAADGGRRCSSRRSSPSAPSSTSCTRSCPATTTASCTRSRLTPSGPLARAAGALAASRCSSRLAGLREGDGGRGRWRPSSPEPRPPCTC